MRGLRTKLSPSPPPLCEGSGASPEERAERRQVTVMFSDLVGSTALSAREACAYTATDGLAPHCGSEIAGIGRASQPAIAVRLTAPSERALARSEACVRGALQAYAHALGAFDQCQACCGYQADGPALLRCEIRRPPGSAGDFPPAASVPSNLSAV
jgi:hypothetical protein